MVKLTDINDYRIDENLLSFSMKILRKIIEVEVAKNKDPAADWETEAWEKVAENIEEKQEMLAELDVVGLICRILSQDWLLGDEMFEEAILVAIACLLGGNLTVQGKFFEHMRNDHDNKLLVAIKNRMTAKFEKIKEREISKLKQAEHNRRYKIDSEEEEKTFHEKE